MESTVAVDELRREFRVRDMAPTDVAAVLKCENISSPNPWIRATTIVKYASNGRGLVIEEVGGRLVGFLCLSIAGEDAWIDKMAVAPDRRRRGYGAVLLVAAKEKAAQCGKRGIGLNVREANRAAVALYMNNGFVVEGREEDYYTRGSEKGERTALRMYCAVSNRALGGQ